MSTVSPTLTAALEKKHHEKGIAFLAAPVSGRPERAKEGALWIFLAGDPKAKKYNIFILEVFKAWIRPRKKRLRLFHHCGEGVFVVDGKKIKLPSKKK